MDKSRLLDKVKKDFMEIWDKPGKMGRISVTQKTEGGGYRRHSREGETLEQWYEDWGVYQDDKSLLFNWDVEYKLGRGWDVQFSRSVMSNSLRPQGLQHARPPCSSPTPKACSNSRPLHRWCHPTISSCVIPFSSCLQSFPASGSFQMSQFFASGGQSIGVSASTSVLPMNIQD